MAVGMVTLERDSDAALRDMVVELVEVWVIPVQYCLTIVLNISLCRPGLQVPVTADYGWVVYLILPQNNDIS